MMKVLDNSEKNILPNIQDVLKNILPEYNNGNRAEERTENSELTDLLTSHDNNTEIKSRPTNPNISMLNEVATISSSNGHCIANFKDGSNSSLNPAFKFLEPQRTSAPVVPEEIVPTVGNQYICKVCKGTRASKHALDRHMSVHKKSQPCPYCSKLLKSQGRPDVLRRHLSVCSGYNKQG
jgi:hypothetical protein